MTRALIYSEEQAGKNGVTIAVGPDGREIPFTGSIPAESAVGYFEKHPRDTVTIVPEVRKVRDTDGTPVNEGRWEEWGYDPLLQLVSQFENVAQALTAHLSRSSEERARLETAMTGHSKTFISLIRQNGDVAAIAVRNLSKEGGPG